MQTESLAVISDSKFYGLDAWTIVSVCLISVLKEKAKKQRNTQKEEK